MIRLMRVEDLPLLEKIEQESFLDPYTMEQYEYEINDNPVAYLYVLEEEGDIIAFIDYWITFDACQLTKLAVHPKHLHQGHARALLQHMEDDAVAHACEALLLEVRESNTRAQTIYKKFGFLRINVRTRYYSNNGEDAIVMGKAIGGLGQ